MLIPRRRILRHLGMHQFPGRVRKQRGAAVVAVLRHVTLGDALDVRDAHFVQVVDDLVDRGLRAVGVDTIIAESGVAKATFYKHFPAKDELVLAYLDRVDGVWSGQLHDAAAAAGPEAKDQLVGLFDALGSSCRREGYRGCAFLNAAAESVPGSPVHARTVAHKQAVLGWVRDLAAERGVGVLRLVPAERGLEDVVVDAMGVHRG